MKLGKREYIPKEKDFQYKKYKLNLATLPTLPQTFGPKAEISNWGMLGNDQYGCCVFAGSAHDVMLWTAEGGKPVNFTTQGVLSDYSAVTGFNPNDPSTDNGAYLRDALDYGRKVGFIDANGIRHKIVAFLLLDLLDFDDILQATYIFSNTKLGIQITQTAMDQFNAGQPWTKVTDENPIGGHDVELIAWDGEMLHVVTWGRVQKMSVEFFKAYADEAYAMLSEEFLKNGLSPDGFNMAQLQADLAALTPAPHNFTLEIDQEKIQAPIGKEVTLQVCVKDNTSPLANQTIKVECSGVVRNNRTVATDANGTATFTISCDLVGEEYCSFSWLDPTECSHYATAIITYTSPALNPQLSNEEFIAKLQTIAANYKTAYLWGTFGSPVTEQLITQKANQYPEWYTAARQSYFRSLVGKNYFAFDCVGLIKGILWGWSGDASKSYGGAVYASGGVPDVSADGMIKLCQNGTSDFSSIIPGEAVWMEGHIGVYIGSGKVIECTPAWENGVQVTACLNIGPISGLNGRTWTKHGKLPYIYYSKEEESVQMKEAIVFWSWDDASAVKQIADRLGNCGMFCRNREATAVHPDAKGAKHLINVGGPEVSDHPNVKNLCGATGPDTAILAAQYAKTL